MARFDFIQSFFGFITLRQTQNGRHFPNDIFQCIFLNENGSMSIKISLKFVPNGPINNIPAMVHKMAWRRLVFWDAYMRHAALMN